MLTMNRSKSNIFRVLPEVRLTHLSKIRTRHVWQEVNVRKDDEVHISNIGKILLNLDSCAHSQSCYLEI